MRLQLLRFRTRLLRFRTRRLGLRLQLLRFRTRLLRFRTRRLGLRLQLLRFRTRLLRFTPQGFGLVSQTGGAIAQLGRFRAQGSRLISQRLSRISSGFCLISELLGFISLILGLSLHLIQLTGQLGRLLQLRAQINPGNIGHHGIGRGLLTFHHDLPSMRLRRGRLGYIRNEPIPQGISKPGNRAQGGGDNHQNPKCQNSPRPEGQKTSELDIHISNVPRPRGSRTRNGTLFLSGHETAMVG